MHFQNILPLVNTCNNISVTGCFSGRLCTLCTLYFSYRWDSCVHLSWACSISTGKHHDPDHFTFFQRHYFHTKISLDKHSHSLCRWKCLAQKSEAIQPIEEFNCDHVFYSYLPSVSSHTSLFLLKSPALLIVSAFTWTLICLLRRWIVRSVAAVMSTLLPHQHSLGSSYVLSNTSCALHVLTALLCGDFLQGN